MKKASSYNFNVIFGLVLLSYEDLIAEGKIVDLKKTDFRNLEKCNGIFDFFCRPENSVATKFVQELTLECLSTL